MRRFLELYARVGSSPFRRAELDDAGDEVEDAVRAGGVVRTGPLARTFPCGNGEAGCEREVRGFDDDDDLGFVRGRPALVGPEYARTYVAVCRRSPHECAHVDVTEDQLAQVMISRDALVKAIVRALRIEAAPAVQATREDEPLLLGDEARDGVRRNVWLVARPRRDVIGYVLAAHERDARPSLFLVPTAHAIDPALFVRHGAAAHVELARLDDLLEVRDGAIVARTRLRLVEGVREPGVAVAEVVVTREAAAVAAGGPRLVIDGVKVGTRSTVSVNGQTRDMKDSVFIVLLRFVATEMRKPGTWMTRHELGIVDNSAMTTLVRNVFKGLVPKGFKVLLGDNAGSFRLNPEVVIERVEWGVLEGHPNAGVQRVAREMRGR